MTSMNNLVPNISAYMCIGLRNQLNNFTGVMVFYVCRVISPISHVTKYKSRDDTLISTSY